MRKRKKKDEQEEKQGDELWKGSNEQQGNEYEEK